MLLSRACTSLKPRPKSMRPGMHPPPLALTVMQYQTCRSNLDQTCKERIIISCCLRSVCILFHAVSSDPQTMALYVLCSVRNLYIFDKVFWVVAILLNTYYQDRTQYSQYIVAHLAWYHVFVLTQHSPGYGNYSQARVILSSLCAYINFSTCNWLTAAKQAHQWQI